MRISTSSAQLRINERKNEDEKFNADYNFDSNAFVM